MCLSSHFHVYYYCRWFHKFAFSFPVLNLILNTPLSFFFSRKLNIAHVRSSVGYSIVSLIWVILVVFVAAGNYWLDIAIVVILRWFFCLLNVHNNDFSNAYAMILPTKTSCAMGLHISFASAGILFVNGHNICKKHLAWYFVKQLIDRYARVCVLRNEHEM